MFCLQTVQGSYQNNKFYVRRCIKVYLPSKCLIISTYIKVYTRKKNAKYPSCFNHIQALQLPIQKVQLQHFEEKICLNLEALPQINQYFIIIILQKAEEMIIILCVHHTALLKEFQEEELEDSNNGILRLLFGYEALSRKSCGEVALSRTDLRAC